MLTVVPRAGMLLRFLESTKAKNMLAFLVVVVFVACGSKMVAAGEADGKRCMYQVYYSTVGVNRNN